MSPFRHRRIYFFAVYVIFLLNFNTSFASTNVTQSTITNNDTWTKNNSPYIVNGSVYYRYGSLTIEPGTIIKFATDTSTLVIHADITLNINGTSAEPVYFTSIKDDTVGGDTNGDGNATSPTSGDWGYVSLGGGSLNKIMNIDYIKVRYGGGLVFDNIGVSPALLLYFNSYGYFWQSYYLKNIEVSHSKTGLYIFAGTNNRIYISDSSFYNNQEYAIYKWKGGSYELPGEVIAQNNWWGSAIGPYHTTLNPTGTLTSKLPNGVSFTPWLLEAPTWTEEIKGCTENCNSNVMFLPGVLGSRLFEDDAACGYVLGEKERWVSASDCDHLRLALNADGKSTYSLYTKEGDGGIVDDAYSFNIYQSFMSELKSWEQDGMVEDYALIPYDWRLSLGDVLQNGTTTTTGTLTYATDQGFTNSYIYKKLQELVATSRTGKVTIIAHSNGGLLAKALIFRLKENGDPLADAIDNLILVSVPQVGTPDAVMGLLHGTDLGYGLIMGNERSRMLLNNMPSAYHLIPSADYFTPANTQVTTSIATFDSGQATEIFRNIYGPEINNIVELRNFILGTDGRVAPSFSDTKNPATGNANLLAYAESIYGQIGDNWTPSASTTVHQIAGWGEETPAGINYTTKTDRNCVSFIYNCTDTSSLTYSPSMVIDGDGTVVAPSALAMSTSSPNVKRWWVDLETYNEENIDRNHRNILEIYQLRTFISNIIQGINTLPLYISDTQPPTDTKKRLSFTLHSPLDLVAVDINGNRISSATSTIPGARYKRYGEVQYISLPAETVFAIELDGYTSGSFDLDVALKQGNDTLATTTFTAIPVATTTIATISFSDGTIANASPLAVDYDGNGTVDITLTAKEGKEVVYVPDTISPEATITFATSTKSILFIGRDDITAAPFVTTSATTTTISDEAGNTLTLNHSLKTQKNNVRYTINSLIYATSTQTTIVAKATASYHYLEQKNKHGRIAFNAHLKTKNQNLVAVYNPKKDSTKIILLTKDDDVSDRELEDMDEEKLMKNNKVKEVLPGLVIPYLLTDRGEIIIKY